ncbi:MAG TPA: asparagine synthase-related protein, partial [Thermoplasmata archaeon]|nr:asparagine synthase-related protein [Thermoplasmata archaeon]
VPLQERTVAEYANQLPTRVKMNLTQGKLPLRALLADRAPSLAQRRKQGFEPPVCLWLRGSLENHLRSGARRLTRRGVLDGDAAERLLSRVGAGTANPNELKFAWNTLVVGESLLRYGYAA